MHDSGKIHPHENQLTDFLSGKLGVTDWERIEAHVQDCDLCASRMARIDEQTVHARLRAIATRWESNSTKEHNGDETDVPSELAQHPRYDVLDRIGVGGMGNVYRARHRWMDRDVAIKVLRPHLFANDRAIARFQNEVKVAAQLNHPAIVHSYDAETSAGLHLLVMELVDGVCLSELVKCEPISVRRACEIGIAIAQGLQHAQAQGTIHRDIKPQNVMVSTAGDVKITDFGLAKFVLDTCQGPTDGLTVEGEMFGTPDYMAPEQIRDSRSADHRSDIYSLGCTIYFMLAGNAPFGDLSQRETLAAQLERTPTPLDALRPDIPARLASVVASMMAKDPAQRPASYLEIEQSLSQIANELDTKPDSDRNPTSTVGDRVGETELLQQRQTFANDDVANESRRRWLVKAAGWGGISVAGLGTAALLWPSSPSTKNEFRLAVVFPFAKAYHPEAHQVVLWSTRHPDVTIQYVAERRGSIRFGYRGSGRMEPLSASVKKVLKEISPDDFDAILFCGGWDGETTRATTFAFDPQLNGQAARLIKQMINQGKPIGSVCGGTAVLVKAGILEGKRAAYCPYLHPVIAPEQMAKTKWSSTEESPEAMVVVQDGLLVTGGSSDNVAELLETLYELSKGSNVMKK